jgi:hypothetical protein
MLIGWVVAAQHGVGSTAQQGLRHERMRQIASCDRGETFGLAAIFAERSIGCRPVIRTTEMFDRASGADIYDRDAI